MNGIKHCYSPPNKGHVFIQADYSQLEIRVLALLSRDTALIHDLNEEIDLHTRAASELYSVPSHKVTKNQRKLAKSLSFQLQYGASAKGMASKLEIPEGVARKFINQYYDRYPQIRKWQEGLIHSVESNAYWPTDKVEYAATGEEVKVSSVPSYYNEIDGLGKFTLVQASSSYGGVSFPVPAIKNYPVQGTAADIVATALADLFDFYVARDSDCDFSLIGTVHDSIIVSCPPTLVGEISKVVKSIMEKAPHFIEAVRTNGKSTELPVKFPVDIEVGGTLGSLKPYEV